MGNFWPFYLAQPRTYVSVSPPPLPLFILCVFFFTNLFFNHSCLPALYGHRTLFLYSSFLNFPFLSLSLVAFSLWSVSLAIDVFSFAFDVCDFSWRRIRWRWWRRIDRSLHYRLIFEFSSISETHPVIKPG